MTISSPSEPVWVLDDALVFVRELKRVVGTAGYAVALGGSVLYRGSSTKDLDVILFPLSRARQDQFLLKAVLKSHGLEPKLSKHEVMAGWARREGSEDSKHVEVWDWQGKRVDLLFLS